MAEEHPPSPVKKDKPKLQEIAGQARNDVLSETFMANSSQ